MAEYELVDETNGYRYNNIYLRVAYMLAIYVFISIIVFLTWNAVYSQNIEYPPRLSDVPDWWYRRALYYANSIHGQIKISHDFRIYQLNNFKNQSSNTGSNGVVDVKQLESEDNEKISNYVYHNEEQQEQEREIKLAGKKLVCYYSTPNNHKKYDVLRLSKLDPTLCTHINVGLADVHNNQIILSGDLTEALKESIQLRQKNPKLKILLWVGGADSNGFVEMVRNHDNRKVFCQSLRRVLKLYSLNGVDLDWEFPSPYNKERQHFSQLLYEIRREYQREKVPYLLSLAVAATEGIAYFAYDFREINLYADYLNVMTYDYHFYSHGSPFTGLNSPLYARPNEHSLMGTLNINHTINFWIKSGLDRNKLVVGLPTYGHSFNLVNPFNNGIGAPSDGIGQVGSKGFVSLPEVCWFETHNIFLTMEFDEASCSPYIYGGAEWISFENVRSIQCKTHFITAHELGGVMIFSLNTDDFNGLCNIKHDLNNRTNASFPLIKTVRSILFSESRRR